MIIEIKQKDVTTINEQIVKITVYNYNKVIGYMNEKNIQFFKKKGKKCKEQYNLITSLKLNREQRSLLTAFINSLNQ